MTTYSPRSEQRILTVEEFDLLPDDELHQIEVVRGLVVREPGPEQDHGWLQAKLIGILSAWLAEHPVGTVIGNLNVVVASDPLTLRVPDVAFCSAQRLEPGKLPPKFPRIRPDLVIEIISPSNSASDTDEKVLDFLGAGVREVWVVYPATRRVDVHRSATDIHVLRSDGVLEGGEILPGLRIPLQQIFGW
jgi:Uma2 family endonuclease